MRSRKRCALMSLHAKNGNVSPVLPNQPSDSKLYFIISRPRAINCSLCALSGKLKARQEMMGKSVT